MNNFIYMFKKGDLVNIGSTNNVETSKRLLLPDQIITIVQVGNPEKVLSAIQNAYKESRLPQSDYYNLNKIQKYNCKMQLLNSGDKIKFKPFFSGIKLAIFFIFSWVSISFALIFFLINPILSKLA